MDTVTPCEGIKPQVSETKITTDDMELEVSGSGKIKIEKLEANEIEAEISGSGKIYLGGDKEAQSLEFDISGSGDIYADGIKVKNIEVFFHTILVYLTPYKHLLLLRHKSL